MIIVRHTHIIKKGEIYQKPKVWLCGHNFCRSDGRLVKLFLFSTLPHKSSLTSIYFATSEKKREVRSPLPTQPNFLVFGIYIYIYIYIYI